MSTLSSFLPTHQKQNIHKYTKSFFKTFVKLQLDSPHRFNYGEGNTESLHTIYSHLLRNVIFKEPIEEFQNHSGLSRAFEKNTLHSETFNFEPYYYEENRHPRFTNCRLYFLEHLTFPTNVEVGVSIDLVLPYSVRFKTGWFHPTSPEPKWIGKGEMAICTKPNFTSVCKIDLNEYGRGLVVDAKDYNFNDYTL